MRIDHLIQRGKVRLFGNTNLLLIKYKRRFNKYSFTDLRCNSQAQFEASITRLYHTIEKGLSYTDYRPGFGKRNVEHLISSLEQYSTLGYDINAFFYKTALSCLQEYIHKNEEYGLVDEDLAHRFESLKGVPNQSGGTIIISNPEIPNDYSYAKLVKSRHSIRHFSEVPVDIGLLESAIALAQYTPSACNRQGWKTRIIKNKELISKILENQNGNRGFGQEIDKLLVITADLCAQQKNREIFQAFIDGGMYAESVIDSLYYYGIGSIPLSASVTVFQEDNIRNLAKINDSEVLILFIGVGNYPTNAFLTTKSERRPVNIEVI